MLEAKQLARPRPYRHPAFLRLTMGVHAAALLLLGVAPHRWGWAASALLLNHSLMTSAAVRPRSRLLGPNLSSLPSARAEVALTFDDGPDPLVTPRVLDLLDAHHARATFFCIGNRVERFPEVAAAIVERGHAIGNHSHSHPNAFAFYGPRAVAREVAPGPGSHRGRHGRRRHPVPGPGGDARPIPRSMPCSEGIEPRLLDTSRPRHREPRRRRRGLSPDPRTETGRLLLLHDGAWTRDAAGGPIVLKALPRVLEANAGHGPGGTPLPGLSSGTGRMTRWARLPDQAGDDSQRAARVGCTRGHRAGMNHLAWPDQVPVPMPTFVQLRVTNLCNLRCKMCGQWETPASSGAAGAAATDGDAERARIQRAHRPAAAARASPTTSACSTSWRRTSRSMSLFGASPSSTPTSSPSSARSRARPRRHRHHERLASSSGTRASSWRPASTRSRSQSTDRRTCTIGSAGANRASPAAAGIARGARVARGARRGLAPSDGNPARHRAEPDALDPAVSALRELPLDSSTSDCAGSSPARRGRVRAGHAGDFRGRGDSWRGFDFAWPRAAERKSGRSTRHAPARPAPRPRLAWIAGRPWASFVPAWPRETSPPTSTSPSGSLATICRGLVLRAGRAGRRRLLLRRLPRLLHRQRPQGSLPRDLEGREGRGLPRKLARSRADLRPVLWQLRLWQVAATRTSAREPPRAPSSGRQSGPDREGAGPTGLLPAYSMKLPLPLPVRRRCESRPSMAVDHRLGATAWSTVSQQ